MNLKDKRLGIISNTTTEQRVNQMKQFLNELEEFGKKNFPKKNVFLDDLRPQPKGFMVARNYYECINILESYTVNILSLDHDLGEKKTGYDVTKWMVENDIWAEQIYLHTANPVGRANMYQLLNNYKPDEVRLYNSPMPFYNLATGEKFEN
jgi:hypothetical protein